jgi:hypothetical protein
MQTKASFLAALQESEYSKANLEYYYEIVKNWSESTQARKKDWIATVKNWMLRDFKEGKLVTHEPSNLRPTNSHQHCLDKTATPCLESS